MPKDFVRHTLCRLLHQPVARVELNEPIGPGHEAMASYNAGASDGLIFISPAEERRRVHGTEFDRGVRRIAAAWGAVPVEGRRARTGLREEREVLGLFTGRTLAPDVLQRREVVGGLCGLGDA